MKASITGGDYRVIRQGIERLDKATRRFAELMMDNAVTGAIGGKTMQSAGESLGEGPTAPHPFAKADIEDKALPERPTTMMTIRSPFASYCWRR